MMHQTTKLPNHSSPRQRLYNMLRSFIPAPGNLFWMVLLISLTLVGQDAFSTSAAPFETSAATVSSTTIPYQGYLTDEDGKPLTGSYNVKFCLYNSATGGSSLWCEQWDNAGKVQITDGLFNVLLGSVSAIPQDIITDNVNLFLGVAVGNNDEMTPRVQLGSVLTAVQALTVPDGSISSEKLNLAHGESCLSGGDLEQAMTGSNRSEELSSPKLSFTLDKPSLVAVSMNGLARLIRTTRAAHSVSLTVDGQNVLGAHEYEPNDWFNLKGQKLLPLAAGEHVLQLKANSAAPGTMVLRGALHWRACVSYLVLGEQ